MNATKFINCPHCGLDLEILEINCKIFRCGVYKNTFKQIYQHLNKKECDALKSKDLIYGCSKPFYYDGSVLKIIDYI